MLATRVIRPGSQSGEIFLEYDIESNESVQQQEADRFASELLIPSEILQQFLEVNPPPYVSKVAIKEFTEQLNISTGIIVGTLQYEKHLSQSNCNNLRLKVMSFI